MPRAYTAILVAAFVATISYSSPAFAASSAGQILDAYKAATGGSAWDNKVTMSGEITISGYGLTGVGHIIADLRNGRTMTDYMMGPAGGANGFDGATPWQKDMSGTVTLQQGGDALMLAVNDAYRTAGKWWQPDRGGAEIVGAGEKTEGGATYEVLTITPKGGKPFDAWFDAKTHLLAKTVEKQGSQTVTVTLSDYRRTDGVLLPYKQVTDAGVGEKYLRTITVTSVAFLGPQPDSAYAPPKVTITDFSIAGGAAQTKFPIQLINNH
ncbi:MAG TPA: hypothetical protein VGC27_06785, partial [Rhizomicrobium sp.]